MGLEAHIDSVVRRAKAFYNATAPGHFLVKVQVPAAAPPIPPLYEFDLDEQLTEYLDYRLAGRRPGWRAKEGLDDDSVPALWPECGIGDYSAWLGMEVQLQEDTCLSIPILNSPEDLDGLSLSEDAKWFRYAKAGYEYLRSRKDGTFVLAVRGTMMPMDLANAVRGNALFTDFLLEPEFAHRLMAFLVEAIDWYYRHLCSWADEIAGGYVFTFGGGWVGRDCLGPVSNDATMLCSSEVYEEFGFPYERMLAERYGCVLYHVHNEKMHYVPRLAQLPGLAMLEVSNDPKTPATIEDLPRVLGSTGTANLMLHVTSEELLAHIDELAERNVYFDVTCNDRKDAEDIIAFVRDRSKPL